MGQSLLYPSADTVNEATLVPASGTAAAKLDDILTAPTVPDTTTDYIQFTAASKQTVVSLPSHTLTGGETVASSIMRFYCSTGSAGALTVQLRATSGQLLATGSIPAGSATGWYQIGYVGPLTQTRIDDLDLRFATNSSASGTWRIYSAYCELNYESYIWAAGNSLLAYNWNPATGNSNGAGYTGGDQGNSADLGSGRSAIFFCDSGYAKTAGESSAAFVRNQVLILDSYDVEAASATSYVTDPTGSPSAFFPNETILGVNCHFWPFCAIKLDSDLIVVGPWINTSTLFDAVATGVKKCTNTHLAPSSWTVTDLAVLPPSPVSGIPITGGMVDGGDGFVYMFARGPVRELFAYRQTRTKTKAGDLLGGQFLTPRGWSRRQRGTAHQFTPGSATGRKRQKNMFRNRRLTNGLGGTNPSGSPVNLRSDGKWQVTALWSAPLLGISPRQLGYALITDLADAVPAPTMKFTVPEGEAFVYNCAYHPQLTFPGAGVNDQVWSYATNGLHDSYQTDDNGTYGTLRFAKALGAS